MFPQFIFMVTFLLLSLSVYGTQTHKHKFPVQERRGDKFVWEKVAGSKTKERLLQWTTLTVFYLHLVVSDHYARSRKTGFHRLVLLVPLYSCKHKNNNCNAYRTEPIWTTWWKQGENERMCLLPTLLCFNEKKKKVTGLQRTEDTQMHVHTNDQAGI